MAQSRPERLTEVELMKVGNKLVTEWFQVGLALGISHAELEKLRTPAQGGPEQFGAKMLQKWWQNEMNIVYPGCRHHMSVLKIALRNTHRNDLADKVNACKINNASDVDNLFQDLSLCLTTDWETLGIYLDVDSNARAVIKASMQQIVTSPGKEMLEMWYKRVTEGQRTKLIAVLRKCNRNDIVETLVPTEPAQPTATDSTSRTRSTQPEGGPLVVHTQPTALPGTAVGLPSYAQVSTNMDVDETRSLHHFTTPTTR